MILCQGFSLGVILLIPTRAPGNFGSKSLMGQQRDARTPGVLIFPSITLKLVNPHDKEF